MSGEEKSRLGGGGGGLNLGFFSKGMKILEDRRKFLWNQGREIEDVIGWGGRLIGAQLCREYDPVLHKCLC